MEIIQCDQRSDVWREARRGMMTGSNAKLIMTGGKTLESYIYQIMSEKYCNVPRETFVSYAMQQGIDNEPIARELYEKRTKRRVREVGFIKYNDYAGVSPDGLVGKYGAIEIKCPTDSVYFRVLVDNYIDPAYMAQMQMLLLVTGRKWCDYVVYNGNFEQDMVIIRVSPDEKIQAKIKEGLIKGEEIIKSIEEKLLNK